MEGYTIARAPCYQDTERRDPARPVQLGVDIGDVQIKTTTTTKQQQQQKQILVMFSAKLNVTLSQSTMTGGALSLMVPMPSSCSLWRGTVGVHSMS